MAADGHTFIETRPLDLTALVRSTRVWSEHACPSRFVISPQAFNDARAVLGAEIARVTGAELRIAEIAAGAYLNTPADPMASFGDIYSGGNGFDLSQAQTVLRAWLDATMARAA